MHFLHLLHGVLAHEARVGSEVHGRVAGERDCVFPLVGSHDEASRGWLVRMRKAEGPSLSWFGEVR